MASAIQASQFLLPALIGLTCALATRGKLMWIAAVMQFIAAAALIVNLWLYLAYPLTYVIGKPALLGLIMLVAYGIGISNRRSTERRLVPCSSND